MSREAIRSPGAQSFSGEEDITHWGWLAVGAVVSGTMAFGAWLAMRPMRFGVFSWDAWQAKYAELPPDVLAMSAEAWRLTPVAEAAEASGVARSWLDNPGDPEHWNAHDAHHKAALEILGIINALHREPAQAAPENESDEDYRKRVDASHVLEERFRPLQEAHEALAKYHMAKKMPSLSDHPPSHGEAMALVRKFS